MTNLRVLPLFASHYYEEHGASLVHSSDELTVLYVDHEPFPFPGLTVVFPNKRYS